LTVKDFKLFWYFAVKNKGYGLAILRPKIKEAEIKVIGGNRLNFRIYNYDLR